MASAKFSLGGAHNFGGTDRKAMFHRVHIGLAHGGEYDIIESFVVIEIERAVDGVRKRNENDAMTAPANRRYSTT